MSGRESTCTTCTSTVSSTPSWPALEECLKQAEERNDQDALRHLRLHKVHYDKLYEEAARGRRPGRSHAARATRRRTSRRRYPKIANPYLPRPPAKWEDLGLPLPFLFDLILRTIYNRGQLTGGGAGARTSASRSTRSHSSCSRCVSRRLIDIVGQKGSSGDASFVYEIKPPKGTSAVQEALGQDRVRRPGPGAVRRLRRVRPGPEHQEARRHPAEHPAGVRGPGHHGGRVQRDRPGDELRALASSSSDFPATARRAWPSASPGSWATSIYIPHAVEANGQIIKVFDPILHTEVKDEQQEMAGVEGVFLKPPAYDDRFVRVKRPTIVVGGELTYADARPEVQRRSASSTRPRFR